LILLSLPRAVAIGVALLLAAAGTGVAQMTIPDSLFQPITLPQTISFGYPPNTIFVPQIHDLTRRRDFDALEAMFGQLAADVVSDVRHESRLLDAFSAFERDEPALLEGIDAWIAARPQSAHARVARASYHYATAWRRRGYQYIRDTPEENIRGMEEFSRKAITDLTAALERDTTHLAAYEILIGVTRLFGSHELALRALMRGTAIHRGSYVLPARFLSMLWPRWGGTEAVMIEFGERAASDAGINPRLVTLRGAVHENRAYDSTLAGNEAGAVRELNKALAFGPERNYLGDRGKAFFRLGAYEYAFTDLRIVVIEQSQNAEALEYYGRTLIELATRARPAIRPTILDRAIESLTLAAYLTPANTRVSAALARARRMAGK
jgi:hypothetical protein